MDAAWVSSIVAVVAALVSIGGAVYARREANAARELVKIEAERLRRETEPSFRATYLPGHQRIAFTMRSGPTDICEVKGFAVADDVGLFYVNANNFDLGMMQIGDTREIPATPVAGRPQRDLQQHFILEVRWRDQMVAVGVYCGIPPDTQVLLEFV
jgi:hypothetical protein